jgi:hypothetical protein
MGYSTGSGRWADTQELVFANALAVSGNTDGTAQELGDKGVARLTLTASAVGAGTTVTVYVETSKDNSSFRNVGNFTGLAAPGTEIKSFSGLDRWVRIRYAFVGGTTTATLTVSGEAV